MRSATCVSKSQDPQCIFPSDKGNEIREIPEIDSTVASGSQMEVLGIVADSADARIDFDVESLTKSGIYRRVVGNSFKQFEPRLIDKPELHRASNFATSC